MTRREARKLLRSMQPVTPETVTMLDIEVALEIYPPTFTDQLVRRRLSEAIVHLEYRNLGVCTDNIGANYALKVAATTINSMLKEYTNT